MAFSVDAQHRLFAYKEGMYTRVLLSIHFFLPGAARKAGAAEDVCQRVKASPASLREQLSGPRLLKGQVYYPQVSGASNSRRLWIRQTM